MIQEIKRMALSDNDTHLGTPLQAPGTGGSYSGPSADRESTQPSLYAGLPKTSTQTQPPKDTVADHMGTPVKPIAQPVPTANTSGGMPYADYDY